MYLLDDPEMSFWISKPNACMPVVKLRILTQVVEFLSIMLPEDIHLYAKSAEKVSNA